MKTILLTILLASFCFAQGCEFEEILEATAQKTDEELKDKIEKLSKSFIVEIDTSRWAHRTVIDDTTYFDWITWRDGIGIMHADSGIYVRSQEQWYVWKTNQEPSGYEQLNDYTVRRTYRTYTKLIAVPSKDIWQTTKKRTWDIW